MNPIPQHLDDIKAVAENCTGTPAEKLIAVLQACGVTSTTELARLVGISDRAIRKAKNRNHSSAPTGTTVPPGTTGPEPQFRNRNHSSGSRARRG